METVTQIAIYPTSGMNLPTVGHLNSMNLAMVLLPYGGAGISQFIN